MSTAHKSENMPSLGSCLDVSAALCRALEIPVYHQGASVAGKMVTTRPHWLPTSE